MSGMAVMAGGPTAKENREGREGGSEPRAHLLEQLAGDSGARAAICRQSENIIAEEVGAVAAAGRQGTAGDREKPNLVRGHHGRIIARGS